MERLNDSNYSIYYLYTIGTVLMWPKCYIDLGFWTEYYRSKPFFVERKKDKWRMVKIKYHV